jgi:hypothetical protein
LSPHKKYFYRYIIVNTHRNKKSKNISAEEVWKYPDGIPV